MAKDVPNSIDAEDEESVDGEVVETKKKPPLKLIVIGAVASVLILGGGGAAAFLLMAHKAPAHASAKKDIKRKSGEKKDDKTGVQVSEGPDGVVFYTPQDMVVNMQTS